MKDFVFMFVRSISIENFRCYKNLQIDFIDKNIPKSPKGNLTLIVAKNGEGKSSLLDAINIGLGTFVGKMPESKGQGFKKSDIRFSCNSEYQYINNGMPKVTLQIVINDQEYTVVREVSNSNKKIITSQKDASYLTSFASEVLKICNEQDVKTILPIVAYYGDHRIFASDNFGIGAVKPMLKRSRQYAYANSMNANSNYKEFIQWYIHTQIVIKDAKIRQEEAIEAQKTFLASDIKHEVSILHEYCNKLYDIIEKVFADFGWNHLSYSLIDSCIFIERINKKTGVIEEKIPINNLSAGTKAVLGIVTDLFYRCFTLNPQSYLFQEIPTSGIVLIDEIDLHLHPLWQQQILPIIQQLFPNIQFVVTTHSPQVVSSVPAECVRIIDKGNVSKTFGTEGAESSRILKRIFGTDPFPSQNPQRMKLHKYLTLVYDNKWNEAQALSLREELDAIYQGEEPLLDQADLFIENEKWELANNA